MRRVLARIVAVALSMSQNRHIGGGLSFPCQGSFLRV